MRTNIRPATFTLVSLSILLVFVSLGGTDDGHTLRINEKNNGQSIDLRVGQGIDVVLDENPTTGYQWEIVSPDKTVINQSAEPEFRRDSDLMGTGGKKTFHFKALSPGETTLRLIYRRSWEKDVPPSKSLEVTIRVR